MKNIDGGLWECGWHVFANLSFTDQNYGKKSHSHKNPIKYQARRDVI